jgi:hypothetical protein
MTISPARGLPLGFSRLIRWVSPPFSRIIAIIT